MTKILEYFYHATFKDHLPSIKKHGLGAKQIKNYDFSEDGVVYLARDPYVAESYCEVAEDTPDEVYDTGIEILCIRCDHLDIDKIEEDGNQALFAETYQYRGVIKPGKINVWTENGIAKL